MPRSMLKDNTCLITNFESQTIKYELQNDDWINALNEEIDHIVKTNTWTLAPRFNKKMNERGEVVRDKAKIVCKGYTQEE